MSLERGRRQENLRGLSSVNRREDGFGLARRKMDIQPPESSSDRKRFVARYSPHMNFEAFEFKGSYWHN
jgi:hypothetical protein